jgi:pimeloyl-ACP methyl ester carboxylesterase
MKPALLYGNGPRKAIVMNGWLGCAANWQSMLEAVDPTAFELAVFDYRGYGTRRDTVGAYTFEEAAQDVLALADQMSWDRFALIGHSMGGMAIQRVALEAPGRVDGLLGLAPVSAAGSCLSGDRLKLFEQAVTDESVRQRIVDFSTGGRLSAAWCVAMARAAGSAHLPQAMLAYLMQWGQSDFAEQARTLALPTRVIVGQHDPSINMVSVATTWLVHHPHASVVEVFGVGHYLMQEAPASVGSAVERWLTNLKL